MARVSSTRCDANVTHWKEVSGARRWVDVVDIGSARTILGKAMRQTGEIEMTASEADLSFLGDMGVAEAAIDAMKLIRVVSCSVDVTLTGAFRETLDGVLRKALAANSWETADIEAELKAVSEAVFTRAFAAAHAAWSEFDMEEPDDVDAAREDARRAADGVVRWRARLHREKCRLGRG
ncbi:hypothetical protein GCM10023195_42510 [Actinoallomurus liliacearum]|uniref:SCP2 domain-containing protein n=1 Tax=Actinoallomurus liliacearum TaxID=1080073 RepID=A0ABP8TMQ6_9ACTN